MSAWGRLIAHDDPLMRAASVISLMVAGNQPTYPLYLWWMVGGPWWLAWWLVLSVPFFIAVPLVGRRWSLGGRLLLPLTGIANVVAAGLLLGDRAGLSALLLPCAGIAAMLFRADEWPFMLALVGLAMAAWLFLAGHPNVAFLAAGGDMFSAAQYATMTRLNALSALALFGFLGMTAGPARAG